MMDGNKIIMDIIARQGVQAAGRKDAGEKKVK